MSSQAKDVHVSEISLGLDAKSIRHAFVEKLFVELAKFPGVATVNDHYMALSYAVRDRLLHRWVRSARTYLEGKHRTVVYLSAEYLLGPQLAHNMQALGIEREVREAMDMMGLDLDELIEHEEEPGLGNGGLGRLAACFVDSLATLDIPAIGHGIRYEFGIFDQEIKDGWQIEKTDLWLRRGNPWEVRRWDIAIPVGLGGRTEHTTDVTGRLRVKWIPERIVLGVPYDTPVLGYGTSNANFLRLWSAVATEEFDLNAFQVGEYTKAVEDKVRSENITKVLYPNDSSMAGKQLRLEQQYFFVSCALQDCVRFMLQNGNVTELAEKFAIQLNDTHPTVGIPELMRILIDQHGLGWDEAWDITSRTFAYTNHTLLPEALETWPLPLFQRVLPRHLEIIYEINRRFLDEVRARFPGDDARASRMSLIDERGEKAVRMAHLATVASRHINGVAALHSTLLRQTVLADFAEMWPERFLNVTNGVTPRRFVALSNPGLSRLVSENIGDEWPKHFEQIARLEPLAGDAGFREKLRAVKRINKERFTAWLAKTNGQIIDPKSLFDCQVKRIHEYKRQHLALLHALWQLERIKRGDTQDIAPRTVIFAGKAAPAYDMAKRIIRLIHAAAEAIDKDPVARQLLRVVFVPDFNVKNAQRIYPAADLSEQISTAGMEASGTGNMKFAMNGALTIGTLDGANVEIREAVGAENFFLFGMDAHQVSELKPRYRASEVLAQDPELADILQTIADGKYSRGDREVFASFTRTLVEKDPFMVLADFRAYCEAQRQVARLWADHDAWSRACALNIARMGRFSSDRSIREYARDVWRAAPVSVLQPEARSLPPRGL